MMKPLVIDYYSDVLCVWAWIAQRKIQELQEEWGGDIDIRCHYINLFGDTQTRIKTQWGDRGLYSGFSRHVLDAAAPYDNAPVSDAVWDTVRPLTSSNAHLVLKAVALTESAGISSDLAFLIQKSFFVDAYDIGKLTNVLQLVEHSGGDVDKVRLVIDSGEAMAALMSDYQKAAELKIKGSPTWIMNNGRQELFGNVGYRILRANIKEILARPTHEASWC